MADRCPACSSVSIFGITDIYKVSHLYYISLGGGSLQASIMKCGSCGHEQRFEPRMYAGVMPFQVIMNLHDIVEATNPRLFAALTTAGGVPSPSSGDPRAAEALSQLNKSAELDGTSNMLRLRLLTFDTLEPAARDTLLQEVERYIDDRQQERRAVSMLTSMASVPMSWKLRALFWVLVVGGTLLIRYLTMSWEYGLLVWLGAIAFLYYLSRDYVSRLDQASIQEWLRDVILPSAKANKISIPLLCQMMAETSTTGNTAILSQGPTLERLAREANLWSDADRPATRSAIRIPLEPAARFPRLAEVFGLIVFTMILYGTITLLSHIPGPVPRPRDDEPHYPPPRAAATPDRTGEVAKRPTAGTKASTAPAPSMRLADGTLVPPELSPRPGVPAGIHGMWASVGASPVPSGVKTTFGTREPLYVTLLYVGLYKGQKLSIRVERLGQIGEHGQELDLKQASEGGTALIGVKLVQPRPSGHYKATAILDERPLRSTEFVVND